MGLQPVAADRDGFRAALGSLASTVNVITMWGDGGRPLGMTATAFSSVSVDPLLILVCVNRSARTYEHISAAGRFGVNTLGSHAREVSEHCARPGSDKQLRPEWLARDPRWHTPALAGALVHLDCAVDQDVAAGTHAVLIGRVQGIGLDTAGAGHEPLLHFRGAYRQLQPRIRRPRPRPLPISSEEYA